MCKGLKFQGVRFRVFKDLGFLTGPFGKLKICAGCKGIMWGSFFGIFAGLR